MHFPDRRRYWQKINLNFLPIPLIKQDTQVVINRMSRALVIRVFRHKSRRFPLQRDRRRTGTDVGAGEARPAISSTFISWLYRA